MTFGALVMIIIGYLFFTLDGIAVPNWGDIPNPEAGESFSWWLAYRTGSPAEWGVFGAALGFLWHAIDRLDKISN
jgi:hypothetical protein